MDVTLWCGGCINHVKLINQVFPNAPGEEGPRNSNLAQLVFYAETKSTKLRKIGLYLEKRTLIDLRKQRSSYVKIDLEILNSLISHCSSNINLFATSVLKIVYETISYLGPQNPDMMLHATTTFVTFSQYYQHDSTIDAEFADTYAKVLAAFCRFATYKTNDEAAYHKLHLSGLRAVQAVLSTVSFSSGQLFESHIEIIVHAILQNLLPTQSDPSIRKSPSKRGSITDELITDDELVHVAKSCLTHLFSRTNATTLKLLLVPTYAFYEKKNLWNDIGFVVYVLTYIAEAVPSQYRYVVTTSVVDRLCLTIRTPANSSSQFLNLKKTSEVSTSISSEQKSALIKVFNRLIESGIGISGMTVLELLEILLNLLSDCSFSVPSEVNTSDSKVLIKSVGNLAAHIQYPDQLNDIFAIILNRLRALQHSPRVTSSSLPVAIPTSSKAISDHITSISEVSGHVVPGNPSDSSDSLIQPLKYEPMSAQLRFALFECLIELVKKRIEIIHSERPQDTKDTGIIKAGHSSLGTKSGLIKRSSVFRNPVNMDVIVPMISFLLDEDENVRGAVIEFLCSLVDLETADNANREENSPSIHKFQTHIHRTVFQFLQKSHLTPFDYGIVFKLLICLVNRYKIHQILNCVSLLFANPVPGKFLDLYFSKAADYCGITGFTEPKLTGSWTHFCELDVDLLKGLQFQSEDKSPGDLTREKVIEIFENNSVVTSVVGYANLLRARFGEGDMFLDFDERLEKQDIMQIGSSAPGRMQRRKSSGATSSADIHLSVVRKPGSSIRTTGGKSIDAVTTPTIKFDELKDALLASSTDLVPPVPPIPPIATIRAAKQPSADVASLLKSISDRRPDQQPSPEPQMYKPSPYTTRLSPPLSSAIPPSVMILPPSPDPSTFITEPNSLPVRSVQGLRASDTESLKHSISTTSLRMKEPKLRDFA